MAHTNGINTFSTNTSRVCSEDCNFGWKCHSTLEQSSMDPRLAISHTANSCHRCRFYIWYCTEKNSGTTNLVKSFISSLLSFMLIIKNWEQNTVPSVFAKLFLVFTMPVPLVSDEGYHFKNEFFQNLDTAYRIFHTFSVSYSPCVNRTV